MAINDKDRGSSGSSGKSPTKFKERPSDKSRNVHPENVRGGESPMMDEQDPSVEKQQEGQDQSEAIREKVRRTIPKPGHPGEKVAQDPSDKGVSGKSEQKEGEQEEKDDSPEGCV